MGTSRESSAAASSAPEIALHEFVVPSHVKVESDFYPVREQDGRVEILIADAWRSLDSFVVTDDDGLRVVATVLVGHYARR